VWYFYALTGWRGATQMQYHGPDTFIQIKITSKLKADVEAAAVAESQTVNAWITGLLEAAIAQAQEFAAMKLNAEEKRHRESEARLNSIIEKHRGK
jgi:hypothetical protein